MPSNDERNISTKTSDGDTLYIVMPGSLISTTLTVRRLGVGDQQATGCCSRPSMAHTSAEAGDGNNLLM